MKKNNNMQPLDLNSGWEKVVNPKTAQRRASAEHRMHQWLVTLVVLMAVLFANLMLLIAGAYPGAVASVVSVICCTCSGFTVGRMYEAVQR